MKPIVEGDDLLHLGGDRAVAAAEVEGELARLWQQAAALPEQGAGAAGVTRACHWNLVVYHHAGEPAARGSSPGVDTGMGMLGAITAAVPSRVIHLFPRSEAGASGRDVDAWVSAHCLRDHAGGSLMCSEAITLVGNGAEGCSHFPALVRALLVPDLPVALLWLEELPHRGRLAGQLLTLSDRVIIDSQCVADELALLTVQEMVRAYGDSRFVDLGWMRLGPVRFLVAELFDPPEHAARLQRIEEIRIATTPAGRNEGFLLLGWILARCGYRQFKAVDVGTDATPGVEVLYRWNVRRDNRSFSVTFVVRPGEGGYDGLLSLELRAGGEDFAVHQLDAEHVAVEAPHRKERDLALHGWRARELIVAALGGHGEDRVFPEALELAAGLIDAEAWNR